VTVRATAAGRCGLLAIVFVTACSGGGRQGSGTGGAGAAGSGGTTGTGGVPASNLPVIETFVATPAVLPAGGGASTLTWQVMNADSLAIDQGIGPVTGSSTAITVSASTIYKLTATNAHGSVTALTAVGVGQNPASDSIGRYAAMVSPTGAESFTAPATLRLVAAAHDPNVYTNVPVNGKGGNAASVQFFVDDAMVYSQDGADAEYWVFKGFVDGIAAGQHRVWIRALYQAPAEELDSLPMIITVAAPPSYAMTVELTADVVVGNAGYSLVGAAGARVRLDGNGYSIRSSGATSGAVTLQFVDVFGLGDAADTSKPGIDLATSGGLTIEDSTFDTSNTISATLEGAAGASIRRNVFRSNMRMPIGQEPGSPDSYPALVFTGASTAAKVFAGNNVGAGWVELDNAQSWTIGGDTDADSNVLIGPRVGFTLYQSKAIEVRRNYSHHVYYGGWSQGANFELQSSPSMTVEHNVVFGSSWPVRGAGCEFRYNLVLGAGHEWLWPESGGSIHHNVFSGGDNDVGGIFLTYDFSGIDVFNNTLDGGNGWNTAVALQMGSMNVRSNAFVNVPDGPTVDVTGGTLTADYNFFDNPQSNYSDGRKPAHDVGGVARLAMPATTFDLDESVIWNRGTTVAGVLGLYRTRYAPQAGSPLIDAGDPQGGTGNDIGAVGAGQANPADLFGLP
jgi:hypothetical protein